MTLTIALAGNPNAGKSTLFNRLTGAQQHVGNWPGKTVERKEGVFRLGDQEVLLIDLPGTYSLSAFSPEEIITRDFILSTQPDWVVAVVDAANLERNLYLVVQLLEMQTPLILALNMWDMAEKSRIEIDTAKLSACLGGIPVIPLISSQAVGLEALKKALLHHPRSQVKFAEKFHPILEQEINQLQAALEAAPPALPYPNRWLALKFLEGDANLLGKVSSELRQQMAQAAERIQSSTGEAPDILIADGRYSLIADWIGRTVQRPQTGLGTTSDKLDRVLTHPLLGVPIFLLLMWLVFQFTANVSAPYVDWIDATVSGPISRWGLALLTSVGLEEGWFSSLVIDGALAGVGGVLTFVPVLVCLFAAIAILEDSGYMARAAFVMDRFMRFFGLHGKSFVPLVIGFGCSVPAIYATRTLENPTERKITAFLTTFMSCGARLPVYVLFGTIFFGSSSGNLIFGLYLTGIAVAALSSLLLTRVVLRHKDTLPMVIEMPPYRLPQWKNVWIDIRVRTWGFIRNAGTVIFVASLIIWLLLAVPIQGGRFAESKPKDSLFGTVSQAISPIFDPAGFGNWQSSGALITGFVAKEVVIATMNQVYIDAAPAAEEDAPTFGEDLKMLGQSFGEATILTVQEVINIGPRTANLLPGVNVPLVDFLNQAEVTEDSSALESALRSAFTARSAVAFNVFILLYVPCMATAGAMRHEFGWRWMLLQMLYTLVIAWIAAVLVYQVGGLL